MSGDEKHDTRYLRETDKKKSVPVDKEGFWNGRAKEFSEYAASTGYPEEFIRIMRPRKSWTVLDMACGGGTIAIPLAKKVKSITAMDFSKRMLDIVDWRCNNADIRNVRTVHGRWEDNWSKLGIDEYDVAIASRSLIGDNTEDYITKLNNAAKKAVYISMAVGTGPFDRALFESTGRTFSMGKDYIHYYTMLYEMGIFANIAFVPEHHRNQWASHEEAFEDQRWMFHGMSADEEEKIRSYLRKHLVHIDGRWKLPYPRDCWWALMWWKKDREVRA